MLDQRRFLQQGADLAGGFDPVDAPDLLRQRHLFRRAVVGREMRENPLADVLGLADVERQVVVGVEEINAGGVGQFIEDFRVEMRRQAGARVLRLERRLDLVAAAVDVDFLPELADQLRIGQRPVAGVGGQPVPLDQRIQIVPLVLRKQGARQLDGAQHRRPEGDAQPLELVLQEAVIEARVVGDEQPACQPAQGFLGHGREGRRRGHHFVADAGELFDEGRNAGARIHQLLPLAHRSVLIDFDDADFGDAVCAGGGAGGFEVDEG